MMAASEASPAGTARGRSAAAWSASARLGPWLAQAGLPFLLVTYLGLRGGGHDEIVRGEVGIAAWWIMGLGAAIGALPLARLPRSAWLLLGAITAFAVWTALGIGWSESAERSVAELGRVATLLGIFALAVSLQGPDGLRRAVGGVAAGVVVVSWVALLSRLQPAWFPESEISRLVFDARPRLHYPLNYWNGLAALMALGVPLLLALATSARHLAARALALGAVPALCLTAFFTLSRGGAVEGAAALAVLLVLHPRRLALLGPLSVAAAGGAILIVAARTRDELTDGLTTEAAAGQGDEMLVLTLGVCAAVAGLGAAFGVAERRGARPRVRISRRLALRASLAGAVIALAVAIAGDAPGKLESGWDDFKSADVPTSGTARFDSASGSGRYQWWRAALDANATEPLTGIGPGTYEFWWAREGTFPGFVREAHSLYLETLAELGIVGLALLLPVLAIPLGAGIRARRRIGAEEQVLLAGALAGCVAFITAAAIDWVWELTVLPVCFLALAAALVTRGESGPPTTSRAARFGLPLLAVAGLLAIAIPLAGTAAVRESKERVREGDLSGALDEARTASRVQPYAATPRMQEALVLELMGDLDGALAAAREATENETTNWRTWHLLSTLESQAGNPIESGAAYLRARSLNPLAPLFNRPDSG